MKLLQINGGLSFTYCQTFYSTKNYKLFFLLFIHLPNYVLRSERIFLLLYIFVYSTQIHIANAHKRLSNKFTI